MGVGHRSEVYAQKLGDYGRYHQQELCFSKKINNASSHEKHFYQGGRRDVSYQEQDGKEK
jgi:hypothetical protein